MLSSMTVLEFKILGVKFEVRGHFTVMNKGWKFVLTKKFGSKWFSQIYQWDLLWEDTYVCVF